MKGKKILLILFLPILSLIFITGCGDKKENQYTVTFDSQGGTAISKIEVKEKSTISSPLDPEKEGYTFLGWYYQDKLYDFSQKITKDITLVAKWEIKTEVTVTFQIDDQKKTEKIPKGSLLTLPKEPTKEGYTFLGWYQNDQKFDPTTLIQDDITLTAVFEKKTPVDSDEIPAASISLNYSKLSLKVGQKKTITGTIRPTDTTDKQITWVSNNPAIAKVTNGTITALKEGTTTIVAKTKNGKTATVTVTVTSNRVEPDNITLNHSSLKITYGDTATLLATIHPSNATDQFLTWTSSNPQVATVSNGIIEAKKEGLTTVTVTTKNGKTATCTVTVVASYRFELQNNPNDPIQQTVLIKAYKNGQLLYGSTLYFNGKIVGIDTNRAGYIIVDRSEGITNDQLSMLTVNQ